LSLQDALPGDLTGKQLFLAKAFLDPFILSGFVAAFIASLFWMAAMTKLDVSFFAYPFMSLAFVAVRLLSALFCQEPITLGKVLGLAPIVSGFVVTVKVRSWQNALPIGRIYYGWLSECLAKNGIELNRERSYR